MSKHNSVNERMKRQYFAYLKEAKRQSEETVDTVAKALARFEAYTGYREFKTFRIEQAVAFKKHLADQQSQVSGAKLSKATLYATLAHLKRFFQWLAGQPGYKSRFHYTDAEYFNLSDKDSRVATARREKLFPTLEQVKHVIASMPAGTDIEKRNRALVAFAVLTGARDGAIASMKLRHVDIVNASVFQDARDVNTKFSKTFTTYFFPVGDEIRQIVIDWVNHLRKDLLWGNDDPLFPATLVEAGEECRFRVVGLDRKHWSNATPIRSIFREAFHAAGLPYFNPHSLRNTLVRLGETLCKTPEEFKAWSQNLGHEEVLTTFYSYGQVATRRQGEIITELSNPRQTGSTSAKEIAEEVSRLLRTENSAGRDTL
jgi:integrase/recombinase XerD